MTTPSWPPQWQGTQPPAEATEGWYQPQSSAQPPPLPPPGYPTYGPPTQSPVGYGPPPPPPPGQTGPYRMTPRYQHPLANVPRTPWYWRPTTWIIGAVVVGAVAFGAASNNSHTGSSRNDVSRTGASGGAFTMPNEVGQNLQDAQDDIQRVSGNPIFFTHSHDVSGQGRMQILDGDWKVCTQNVRAGQQAGQNAFITFGVVKTYENC